MQISENQNNMKNQKSLKLNAIISLIKACLNILFPIISFPYASRILLPDGTGRVNFANSIVEYFVMFAILGINLYAARETARIRDDKSKLNKLCREILLINFISTILSYVIFFITILFIPKFSDYRVLLIVCSTKILFTSIGMEWLYNAHEEYGYITLRQTLFQIISLILLFGFVKTKEDYLIYAGIGVFSNVGSNLFNMIYSRKFINIFEKTKIEIRKHIKPVMTYFGIAAAGKINSALDAVMLGFMLNDAAVGYYSAAIKISRMVKEMISSAICSFMPRSSYLLEHNQIDEYKKIVEFVCNATYFFCIPAATGMIILSKPLILLFSGEAYLPAVPCMQIISLTVIGMCSTSFLNQLIITPQRKEKYSLLAQVISAFANITLNIVLILKLNFIGAAIATTCVEFILPLILLIPSYEYVKSKENLYSILQSILGSLIMFFAIKYSCYYVANNIIYIIVAVIIGSITYAIVELALNNKTARLCLSMINKGKSK